MKTGRVFPRKPPFPIKLSWKHLYAFFFPWEPKHISLVFVPLRHKGFGFPLELVRLLSPGPFPKDHCIHPFAGGVSNWARIYLDLNERGLRAAITVGQITHWVLQSVLEIPSLPAEPALAAAETQRLCRLRAGKSNSALCRNTIPSIPYKSCVLIEASTYFLQIQWQGRDLAALPLFFSTNLDKMCLWILKISKDAKRQESHMLAKSRVRVKEYLPLHFYYGMLWNRVGRTTP